MMPTVILCSNCGKDLGSNPSCGPCQKFSEFYEPDTDTSGFDEEDNEDFEDFEG